MKKTVLVFALFAAIGLNAQQTHNLNWFFGITPAQASITIEPGDTVIWTFTDAMPHSVTSDTGSTETFDSGIQTGGTYSYTFTQIGTNPYFCVPHGQSMTGVITVQAPPPACPDPSNLNVTSITTNSAFVIWTENGTAAQWEIEYGPMGFAQGSGLTVVDNDGVPGQSISGGLSPNSHYDVYVRSICGGQQSNWVGPVMFMTAQLPCLDPSNLSISNITDTTADISWTENGTATEWEIEYGPQGFAQGSGTLIPDNDGTLGESLSGLTHTTQYEVYVRSLCTGQQSSWVGPVGFTTDTSAGVEDSVFSGFSYYPNPVKDELSIQANHEIKQLAVYDILGKKVMDLHPRQISTLMETASLKPGIYFLKVNIEGSTGTYRLIKD